MFGKLKIEEHNGTVYIPISKTAVKAGVGKYTIYDREFARTTTGWIEEGAEE